MKSPRKWHVLYFEDSKGYSQVFEFIDNREKREKAKILAWLEQLEQQGPNLPRPYADLLEDGIQIAKKCRAGFLAGNNEQNLRRITNENS